MPEVLMEAAQQADAKGSASPQINPAFVNAELFRSLVGRSPGICEVRSLIERVAPTEATVMILGETGTGKEVVARNIHYFSQRRGKPFVAINCGAIPPDLLESELFGHEKGSFTGAVTARKGRFELAHGGTLFLDEVGDMALDMQVKLLRVLQEHSFDRIGGTSSIEADVRIVAATHRDLEAMIEAGTFREDLFYRLNVVPIEMPPLRERREDIPLLFSELNARLSGRGLAAKGVSDAALRAMFAYDWPGNVRELANLVERCSILAPGCDIEVGDLPKRIKALAPAAIEEPQPAEPGTSDILDLGLNSVDFERIELKGLLELLETRLIRQALDKSDGVVAQAAERLGLRRTTLVEKIRKFGIERPAVASEL
jgi:sigma-54 specific flagellar transcriptional regulator A